MSRSPDELTPRRRAFLEAVAACRADGVPASVSHIWPRLESLGVPIPFLSSLNLLAGYALESDLARLVAGGGKRGAGERIFALTSEGERELGIVPQTLCQLRNPVCAGTPTSVGDIETRRVERLEDVLSFDAARDLLVPVCGDSMERAGIVDGDQILVRRLPEGERPRNGEVVVGWVSGAAGCEWTVKHFLWNGLEDEDGAFLLLPHSPNPVHRPLLIAPIPQGDDDLDFAHAARRAHPGWEWLPPDLRAADCAHLHPECVGINWTWTRGLIRGARG